MIEKLPTEFVNKVAKEIQPLYNICCHRILVGSKLQIPTVDHLEYLINEIYNDFVKEVDRNEDCGGIETAGIEIRFTDHNVIEISYKKSFEIEI